MRYADGREAWRVWDDALDQVIGEYTTEAAALAAIGVEQRMLVTPAPAFIAQQEASAGPGASYSPPAVEPAGDYTGRAKAMLDFSEQWAAATSAIKVRADVADVADLEPEQQQLAGPPVHTPSRRGKRGQITGLDRYRVDLAIMSETQLAGEIKKHKATLKKHAGAPWLASVRQRLDLVQVEIDQRDGKQPQAGSSARASASDAAARPLTSSAGRRPAPAPFRGQQPSLFGGAD